MPSRQLEDMRTTTHYYQFWRDWNVSAIYGRPGFNDVDALRHKLFQTCYDMKSCENAFNIPEGLDLCLLPLELHVRRVSYVATIWRNVNIPHHELPSPVGNG